MAFQAASGFLTMEAANIFCGSNGESNHLRLLNVRLPSLEEQYVDHRPGGAPVAIEVDVIINRLECDFRVAGWSPRIDGLLSAWSRSSNQFWVYGALRSQNTGQVYQAVATIFGRLGQARPSAFQRGSEYGIDYSIRGIIRYQLNVAGAEVFNWDFFNNTMQTQAS